MRRGFVRVRGGNSQSVDNSGSSVVPFCGTESVRTNRRSTLLDYPPEWNGLVSASGLEVVRTDTIGLFNMI